MKLNYLPLLVIFLIGMVFISGCVSQKSPTKTPPTTQPETPRPSPTAIPPSEPSKTTPPPETRTPTPVPATAQEQPVIPTPGSKFALWQNPSFFRGAAVHPYLPYGETEGRVYLTKKDFQALRNQGANVISLNYPGPFNVEPPYGLDKDALEYLDTAIDWSEEIGLYVIIHFRNGPGKSEKTFYSEGGKKDETLWYDEKAKTEWMKMWQFVAERYKDKPHVVAYDLMVEPHPEDPVNQEPLTADAWNEFAKRITVAIRQADKEIPLIVSSSGWAGAWAFKDLKPTGDPRTIYSFHNYEPFEFTHQGFKWAGKGDVPTLVYPGMIPSDTYKETRYWNKVLIEEFLEPVFTFQKKHNAIIFVGEFGCNRRTPSCITYLGDLLSIFENRGWGYTYYVWRVDDGFDYEKEVAGEERVQESAYMKLFKKYWRENTYFVLLSNASLSNASGSSKTDSSTTVPQTPTTTLTPARTKPTAKPSTEIWSPKMNSIFQWQLTGTFEDSVTADVYDLDLFDASEETIAALHAKNKRVICYISVGAWENWRPDKDAFSQEVIGKDYAGWPGEKWLDIRRIDLLGPAIKNRFDMAKTKGCDAIEPDNIDGFESETGFPLTYNDQLFFNKWLAEEAHQRGMSIGLKNDAEHARDLLPYFDWALTEDCHVHEWCEQMVPFVSAGKAVFQVEYTDTHAKLEDICPTAKKRGFVALLKHRGLDAWMQRCL